ncbi:MAG: serine protease [bacterium]|nr:serine protease [bacterium]
MRRNNLRLVLAVILLSATMAPIVGTGSVATGQDSQPLLQQIRQRDVLIYQQEGLLNAYRCKFDIHTIVVQGGCRNGAPAAPVAPSVPFAGTPTATELELRDSLVVSQEALLNDYRCRFDVDTEVVQGGCEGNKPATLPGTSGTTGSVAPTASPPAVPVNTATCDFADHATGAIDAVWQVRAGQSLGTAFHLGHASGFSWWLTAEHVIRSSETVQLSNADRTLEARVVTANRGEDIAVLSTSTTDASQLVLGGLAGARPGSNIFAIGYPLYVASTPSISRGIVSRLLDDKQLGRVLQTDTAVNPGNSGGPMLNVCGQVMGMVVSKSAVEGSEGINYSVIEPKLAEALDEAQADPNQSPAPPPEPKPEIGEGSPPLGEWQQGTYREGGDYLWYVGYVDERGNGALIYEIPCGKDYYNLALWTQRWDAFKLSVAGYILYWEEPNQSAVEANRANLSQHFPGGNTRFVLRQNYSTGQEEESEETTRFFFELQDVFRNRGVLLSFLTSPAHEQLVDEANDRTRRQVSC